MLTTQRDPDSPYPASLAGWLRLDYHRRLRPLRGRRKWVTLAAVLASAAAAAWTVLPANHAAHQAGPVAAAHASFNADCGRCHDVAGGPLARLVAGDTVRSVTDGACLQCHDGPIHHEKQLYTPACAGCHREHRGKAELARVADGHCTACHRDLKGHHPDTTYEDVSGFPAGHPEFGVKRSGAEDTAKLLFNHEAHLRLDLRALREKERPVPDRFGDRLDCAACHRPDAEQRYMLPIRYDQHCSSCHPLTVALAGEFQDPATRAKADAFRSVPAPHRKPADMRAELRERLLTFVRDNPVLPRPRPDGPVVIPGKGPRPVREDEWLWVKGQLREAESLLFLNQEHPPAERVVFTHCQHCHLEKRSAEPSPDGLPEYETTAVPERWLPHSAFRHDSHRMLNCLECHQHPGFPDEKTLLRSSRTADVLLPSVETCRQCHAPKGGARTDCVECHRYHDRSRERKLDAPLTIKDFLKR